MTENDLKEAMRFLDDLYVDVAAMAELHEPHSMPRRQAMLMLGGIREKIDRVRRDVQQFAKREIKP